MFNRLPRSLSIWLNLSVCVYKASAVFWWLIWSRWVIFHVHATVFTTSTSSSCTAICICVNIRTKTNWDEEELICFCSTCTAFEEKLATCPFFNFFCLMDVFVSPPITLSCQDLDFFTYSSPAFGLILNLINVQTHWWRIHEVLHRNISSTQFLSPDPDYWREHSLSICALKVSRHVSARLHYSLNKDQLPLSTSVHVGCTWSRPRMTG